MTHTCAVPAGSVVEYPEGVVNSVNAFFDEFLNQCELYGISREFICIDPGFGFAKTTQDNIELLRNLEKTVRDDVFYMTALSRKRFIGELTGVTEASDRLYGTLAADMIALMKGTDMLRVHDVAETMQIISIYNSIK
jgi:dihydropteroate synthase